MMTYCSCPSDGVIYSCIYIVLMLYYFEIANKSINVTVMGENGFIFEQQWEGKCITLSEINNCYLMMTMCEVLVDVVNAPIMTDDSRVSSRLFAPMLRT